MLLSLALLSACGGAPGSATGVALGTDGTSSPTSNTHTYTVVVSGDGVQFAPAIFANVGAADQVDVNPGPQTVPVGGTLTYTNTGRTANAQISRIGTTATPLVATLYKDGVPLSSTTLNSNGDSHDWGTL